MGLLEELKAQAERKEFNFAVQIAVLNNDLPRVEELLRPYAAQPPADGAAEGGEALPARMATWDFRDAHGWAPLHLAAVHGFSELVTLLLDAGSDVNAYHQNDGRTALHRAAEGGEAGVVELLLARNASPNAATTDGDTPLHLAAAGGHTGCARALVAAGGGSVDAQSASGLTPLAMAAMGAREETCAALLEAGADVNLSDENGWAPLHHAAALRAASLCALLVLHGAAVDALTLGKRAPGALCPAAAAEQVTAAIEAAAEARASSLAHAPAADSK